MMMHVKGCEYQSDYRKLESFFNKYGFCDGDDRKAVKWGEKHWDLARNILQEEIDAAFPKGKYLVQQIDMGGCHNPVRMCVTDLNPDGGVRWREAINSQHGGSTGSYGVAGTNEYRHEDVTPEMEAVFNKASQRFAEVIK